MNFLDFSARMKSKYRRNAARYLYKSSIAIGIPQPIISFTFDDFPRSALTVGGLILSRFGLAGTYYASFGLMGTEAPTGDIFVAGDIENLLRDGHELGCHTFAHCHAWETRLSEFENSILQNRRALQGLYPHSDFSTFSYPISPPRPAIKRAMGRLFACCRGGGQRINVGLADLAYLSAYFIEKDRERPSLLEEVINRNRAQCGWLIFATHDVSVSPTPFGCTPDLFESVVHTAVKSGARILTVGEACRTLQNQGTM